MVNQIDQQFIQKLNLLTKEVLRDEAKFYSRNDQRFSVLHNRIFSKTNQTGFAGLPEEDRKKFKKYFYIDETGTTPRQDVPFASSPEEQAFFFDQFRNQVRACTYNFERMDFLKPNFSDEKDQEPDFNGAQTDLLLRGVIYPLVHGLEQREISLVEQRKTAVAATPEAGSARTNPYEGLGDKILVKGISGEFDAVLTFDQLQEISDMEKEIRKKGLPEDQVVRLLKEYVQGRFPQLYLDEQGKITTFLGAEGISATALEKQKGLNLQIRSVGELLTEMKARQGRKLQYQAINAGNGTLGFSAATLPLAGGALGYAPSLFQVNLGSGESTLLEGMSMSVTAGGEQNAVFFLTDNQGATARISADVTEDRISGNENLGISIYDNPEKDDPNNPKIVLAQEDLPLLSIPLRPLYQRLQQTGQYRPDQGKTVIMKIPADTKLPEIPETFEPSVESGGQPPQPEENPPVGVSYTTAGAADRYIINFSRQKTPSTRTAPGTRQRAYERKTQPKISNEPAPRSSRETEAPASRPAAPGRPAAATAQGGRKAATEQTTAQTPAAKPKSMFPKIALAVGLPIAGVGASIFGAAIKIFTNFP